VLSLAGRPRRDFGLETCHDRSRTRRPHAVREHPRGGHRAQQGVLRARDEVDTVAEAALAAGGTEADGPEDHGFMYSRSFFDLDGHGWQVMWMDPAAAQQGAGEPAASMQDADAPA
jgi:hypothetical protein